MLPIRILQWFIYLPIAFLMGIFCRITNPIACLFVNRQLQSDDVGRLGGIVKKMPRENLSNFWHLWQTHDNACDEYWWGKYNESSWFKTVRNWTQTDYDNSRWVRYMCRVLWLNRNAAYGWNYLLLSIPAGQGFQIKKQIPLFGGWYNDVNIGWKAHTGFPRLLYAGRILGLRKDQ